MIDFPSRTQILMQLSTEMMRQFQDSLIIPLSLREAVNEFSHASNGGSSHQSYEWDLAIALLRSNPTIEKFPMERWLTTALRLQNLRELLQDRFPNSGNPMITYCRVNPLDEKKIPKPLRSQMQLPGWQLSLSLVITGHPCSQPATLISIEVAGALDKALPKELASAIPEVKKEPKIEVFVLDGKHPTSQS